jgi:hypothetical protein
LHVTLIGFALHLRHKHDIHRLSCAAQTFWHVAPHGVHCIKQLPNALINAKKAVQHKIIPSLAHTRHAFLSPQT